MPESQPLMFPEAKTNLCREALVNARYRYKNLREIHQDREWRRSAVSREQAVCDVVEAICDGVEGIRANGTSDLQLPPPVAAKALVASLFTKTGALMIRRSPAGTDEERAFHRALGWHLGTGSANLGGPIMSSMMLGRERYSRIDTLAVWTALIMGGSLSGSNSARWGALLGR